MDLYRVEQLMTINKEILPNDQLKVLLHKKGFLIYHEEVNKILFEKGNILGKSDCQVPYKLENHIYTIV